MHAVLHPAPRFANTVHKKVKPPHTTHAPRPLPGSFGARHHRPALLHTLSLSDSQATQARTPRYPSHLSSNAGVLRVSERPRGELHANRGQAAFLEFPAHDAGGELRLASAACARHDELERVSLFPRSGVEARSTVRDGRHGDSARGSRAPVALVHGAVNK